MKKTTIAAMVSLVSVAGCASAPQTAADAPPFECTSIHPEVCALEKQFHVLRYEQAEQNAAIQAAERKRQAGLDRG